MAFVTRTQTGGNFIEKLIRLQTVTKNDLVLQAVHKKLDDLYEKMYKVTPQKTGYLRSTIKYMVEHESDRHVFGMITVSARYAHFVDIGAGGHRRSQPFWSNSIAGFSIEMIATVRAVFATQF